MNFTKWVMFLFVSIPALQAQYSWHTFYPMDRGQAAGQRAVNPWLYPGNMTTIFNRFSGKALVDAGYAQGNGYSIAQWSYDGGSDANWLFINRGNDQYGNVLYEIVNQASGLALVDAGYAQGNGYSIAQWSYDGGSDALWIVVDAGGGYKKLFNQASGLALVDAGYATGDGYSIAQWTDDGGFAAQWEFQLQFQIGAQLTLRVPANSANFLLPSTVAAWPNYYNAHQPVYYLNWCGGQVPNVYVSGSQECLDVNAYEEVISEVPSLDGSPTVHWLGLWAAGGRTTYTVYYDVSVCNALARNQAVNLQDSSNMRPLLFGIPAVVNSTYSPSSIATGPTVCSVNSNNFDLFNQNTLYHDPGNPRDSPWKETNIVTTLYDDFPIPPATGSKP